jgi:ABC-type transport system involved in multi-copper enzyme maturation permease subunit
MTAIETTGLTKQYGDVTAVDDLDPWFGGVILGGWLVVPLGLAVFRFQRGDLV